MTLHPDVKDKRTKLRFSTLEVELGFKHSNKYKYDKSVYKTARYLMTVTCPIHGDWQTTPDNHLRGTGCPKCSPSYELTLKTFKEKALKVHKGRYSYDQSVYTKAHHKLMIKCSVHGVFSQRASEHLKGKGCKKCAKELHALSPAFNRERFKNKKTLLYYIEVFPGIFKIGLTTNTIKTRFGSLKVRKLYTKVFSDGAIAHDTEQKILRDTKHLKVPADFKHKIAGWTEMRTAPFACHIFAALKTNQQTSPEV